MLAGVEMRLARGVSIAPKRTSQISIANCQPRALRSSQFPERAGWLRLSFALIRLKERGDHTQCTNPRRFMLVNASPPA
jgi:hypothetical protein